MRRLTTPLIVAGAVAGLAGAVVTYQSTAATVAERPVSAAEASPTPAPVTKLLPCESGTKLVKGVCVRTKHRIVVREVAAAAPVQAATPARSAGPERGRSNGPRNNSTRGPAAPRDDSGQSHEEEHESESEDDHESEDHELDD